MQRSEKVGTDETADLVRQMREALCIAHEILFGSRPHSQSDWDRLRAASRQSIAAADQWLESQIVPSDPLDWPLPCDIKVGHGTHAKGTKLRSLVARMQVLYDMVQKSHPMTPIGVINTGETIGHRWTDGEKEQCRNAFADAFGSFNL